MADLRCPVTPQKMFAKVQAGDHDVRVLEDNVVEIACATCRKSLRDRGETVDMVLHSYNLLGEHLGTEVVR